MKITITQDKFADIQTPALVVFVFSDNLWPVKEIDKIFNGFVANSIKEREFDGAAGAVLISPTFGKIKAEKVLVAGLGKKKDFTPPVLRKAAAAAARGVQKNKKESFAVIFPEYLISRAAGADRLSKEIVQGVACGAYNFSEFITDKDKLPSQIKEVKFLISDKKLNRKISAGAKEGEIIAGYVNMVRRINDLPSAVVTPAAMANFASDLVTKNGLEKLKITILGKKEIENLKMGGLLGVGKGSDKEPKFIILEYRGASAKEKPYVFCGKGLTFDSGGISIKPAEKMEEMKYDQAGGSAVIGAVGAIAALGLKVNVVGLVPAAENMPSGSAVKPGDILTMHSGKTVEVQNTDAEGRIILADALSYAKKYKPRMVVDLATLTGAVIVALGNIASGLMGNDAKTIGKIKKAAEESGEKVWELPMDKEYDDLIKSSVADMKNIPPGRLAGPTAGAKFLEQFVDYPWAHLDIAGTAWLTEPTPWMDKGATGVGVETLIELVR